MVRWLQMKAISSPLSAGSIIVFSLVFLSSCGLKWGSASPNDTAPTGGTIVAQGSFTSLNGRTAGGTVQIYDMGTSTIVRLVGVTFPAESGLQLSVTGDGAVVSTTTLLATTGSKNYTISASGVSTWNSVTIHSLPKNLDYAQALLSKALW